jgi:general secretion pathway protein L
MTTLLFLPSDSRPWRWLRPADGAVGEGVPGDDARVVAVAPADAVTLHWARLPDRSPAQGVAAARLLVAEASATPASALHVAVGDEGGGAGTERPIGVVDAATMHGWLAALAAAGVDPDAILPAPMLLPAPAEGHVVAEIGGERVVRGPGSGFADEPGLTELITGGIAPLAVADADLAAAIAAALAAPPLDLRQGAFARRRRVEIDWRLVRRLAVLAVALAALTLAIDLVRLARLNLAADAATQEADRLAESGLPRGETVTDPGRQLVERLSRVRGPGRGFSATLAAVYAAVRQVPGSEVTSVAFQPDGTLLVGLATQRESAPTDIKRAIEATGLPVRAGVFQSAGGRVAGQVTVGGAR